MCFLVQLVFSSYKYVYGVGEFKNIKKFFHI